MSSLLIFFLNLFLCLNLGNAQVPPPTSTPVATPALSPAPAVTTISAPPPAAPTSPVISTPTPAPTTSPVAEILGSINSRPGKYDEYQSICRFNEYDTPAFLDSTQQQKRIDEWKEKIVAAPNSVRLKIHLLKEFIDQGKFAEAENYFSKIKSEKLSESERKTADAVFAMTRHDLKTAEATLSKIILEEPKNRDALEYLATIYKIDLNYFEAASAYYDLIKLTKENYDLELCEVQTLDSQHNDAEKTCKKASQKFDTNPYPLIYLGISKREQLKYSEARQYFKDSLKRKPTEMGYSCLGEIFYIKKTYSGSIELFKWAAKVSPRSSRAILGLAWSQFNDKKRDEALETFKVACAKDRRVAAEIRKAFKSLTEEKSAAAKQYAELAQKCTETF